MGKKGKQNKHKKEIDVVKETQKKQQQQTSPNQTPDPVIQKTQSPQQKQQHHEQTPTQNQLEPQLISDANLQAKNAQKPSSDIQPNVETNQEPQTEHQIVNQETVVEPQPLEPQETKNQNKPSEMVQQTNPIQTIVPQESVEEEQKLEQVEVSENIEVANSIQQAKSEKVTNEVKEEVKEDQVQEPQLSDEALKEEVIDQKEEDQKKESKEQVNVLESVENTTQIEAKEEVPEEKENPAEVKEEPAEQMQPKLQQPIQTEQMKEIKEQIQEIKEQIQEIKDQVEVNQKQQAEEIQKQEVMNKEQVNEETQEIVNEETQEIVNEQTQEVPNQSIQEIANQQVKEVINESKQTKEGRKQPEIQQPVFPETSLRQSEMEMVKVSETSKEESTHVLLKSQVSAEKSIQVDKQNSKTSIEVSMGLLDHQLKKHLEEQVLIPISQSQQQPIVQLHQNQNEVKVPDKAFEKLQQKPEGYIEIAYQSQPFQQISMEQPVNQGQSSEKAYLSMQKDQSFLNEAPIEEEQRSAKSFSSNKSRLVKIERFEDQLEQNRKLKKSLDEDNPIKKVGISLAAAVLLSGAAFVATKNKGITAGISVVSFISSYLMQ